MTQWDFDAHDSGQWEMSDWANGDPFNNGWLPDHIAFHESVLAITLDDQPAHGYPYAAGEYRTLEHFRYGLYEVRMKPASASGTVSSFFAYTGPSEQNPHDEIDIEFLGRDTTKLQLNYHTNGVGSGVNETIIDLGFDAATNFHTYGFRWHPDYIAWFVDGLEVHREDGSRTGVPLPDHAGKIMLNLWTGTAATVVWQGQFAYQQPLLAHYDWARFTP